jgi:hypothetical protein
MSIVRRIEGALLALDPATHQRLGDAYFQRRGEGEVIPLGLAAGRDKTAPGTPDTRIRRPDGRYAFVQYTTQPGDLVAKLTKDLAKCLDVSLTGTPTSDIAEVILVHVGKLRAEEERALWDAGAREGVGVRTIGLLQFAQDLYGSHPQLVEQFLGITVDTGQVLAPDDFVAQYDNGRLAAPLTTGFRFRDEQVGSVLEALRQGAVVLISGRQGTGKTRLALECLRRFGVELPAAGVWCVFPRGPDLFQDIQNHFRAAGHYLILVDDANRANRFEYVIELLRDARPDRTISIIATVRDYARDGVVEVVRGLAEPTVVEVPALSDDEIQTLVREEFGIRSSVFLDRIVRLANGNARLAVMAAQIVVEKKALASIADTTALYDEYYRSVRRDLVDLGNRPMLLAAAAIGLLRAVDRTNATQMRLIQELFGLDAETFWVAVSRLHAFEIVDLYDDEIVRVSDQVLATYLFYLAAFRERAIDLAALLTHLLPNRRAQLIGVLSPIFAFANVETIRDLLRPAVTAARRVFEGRGDAHARLHLADVFWFVAPTMALEIARLDLQAFPAESREGREGPIVTEPASVPSPSPLSILSRFGTEAEEDVRIAIGFLIDHVERVPSEAPMVVRVLIDGFGIGVYSDRTGHATATWTAETLALRGDGGRNRLVARVSLAFARSQLATRFQRSEPARGSSITVFDFSPGETPPLRTLRDTLWVQVFALFEDPALADEALGIVEAYVTTGIEKRSRDVVAGDLPVVLDFCVTKLDPSRYRHAALVATYGTALAAIGVPYDATIIERFTNDTTDLAALFFFGRSRKPCATWEEFDQRRATGLAALARSTDAAGVRHVIAQAVEIRSGTSEGGQLFQVGEGVVIFLRAVAEHHPELFADALMEHVEAGNALKLEPRLLVPSLIAVCGPDAAYQRLTRLEYPGHRYWLVAYFMALPAEQLIESRRSALYELVEEATVGELRHSLFDLIKFAPVDGNVMPRILLTVTNRTGQDPAFGHVLNDFFIRHISMGQDIVGLFGGDVALMTRAYLAACASDRFADPSGTVFNVLLDSNDAFVGEWVRSISARHPYFTEGDDARDYTFLWRRPDAGQIMRRFVEAIRSTQETQELWSYLGTFFHDPKLVAHQGEVAALEDQFLDTLIGAESGDGDLMEATFAIMASFEPTRHRDRVAVFLAHNTDVQAFERLPLTPRMRTHWGSIVSLYDGEASFLASLLPLFGVPSFFEHRVLIENRLESVREQIEVAKRSEWVDG